MTEEHSYWYLASYPKSGNTWCRVFITELMRLAGDNPGEELNLNQDIETGAIASSRLWLDYQLDGIFCGRRDKGLPHEPEEMDINESLD